MNPKDKLSQRRLLWLSKSWLASENGRKKKTCLCMFVYLCECVCVGHRHSLLITSCLAYRHTHDFDRRNTACNIILMMFVEMNRAKIRETPL